MISGILIFVMHSNSQASDTKSPRISLVYLVDEGDVAMARGSTSPHLQRSLKQVKKLKTGAVFVDLTAALLFALG